MRSHFMSDTENLFVGKWRIVGFCSYDPSTGWDSLKPYPPEGQVWDFVHEEVYRYRIGSKLARHTGRLKKYGPGNMKAPTTTYAYCPDRRLLLIDRSLRAPEGYWNRYRVEKAGENEYWLHDMEAETELWKGMYVRLRIRKL